VLAAGAIVLMVGGRARSLSRLESQRPTTALPNAAARSPWSGHFREPEGLSNAQIAERLGRAPATIKAYF
jgi:hypothetical protein